MSLCVSYKTGLERLVFDSDRSADRHAHSHLAVLLHLLDGIIPERFIGSRHHRRLILKPDSLCDLRISDEFSEERVDKMLLTVDVDPVDASRIDAGVEFFLRKVGNFLMDAFHSLFVRIRIVGRGAAHQFLLRGKAVLQRIGYVVPLQIQIDKVVGAFEVAEIFSLADLLGKTAVQVAQGIVDVHGGHLLKEAGRRKPGRSFG